MSRPSTLGAPLLALTAATPPRRSRTRRPDVALVDIRMPPNHGDSGLLAAHEIRRHPSVGVLVLSHYPDWRYAARLLEEVPEPGEPRTRQSALRTQTLSRVDPRLSLAARMLSSRVATQGT